MSQLTENQYFIERTKQLMEEKKFSQKTLSERSGITEASVSRYLAGKRTPRYDVVINFAKALEVSPGELLPKNNSSIMSAYEEITQIFARKMKNLTVEERKELANLLLGEEMDDE